MSDLMLHSVLNMPPELWGSSQLDILRRHGRYKQASMRINELESACRMALNAMKWDVGGEPIHSLEVEAIAELKRVLADCDLKKHRNHAASTSVVGLIGNVTNKVFDNEVSFMESCWRYGKDRGYWDELLEFYMSCEHCRIAVLLPCGTTITDTVKTSDVLAWLERV